MAATGEIGPVKLPVLVVIARRPRLGRTAELRAWAADLCARAAEFPGYRYSGVREGREHEVVVELSFHSATELQAWEQSEDRRGLLREVVPLTEGEADGLTAGGVDRLLASTARVRSAPRWRTALMVWLALIPPALLSAYMLTPMLSGWPVPVEVLVSTAPTVVIVVWVTLPLVHALFAWPFPCRS